MNVIDLLGGRKLRFWERLRRSHPKGGECFPETGTKVPYPNPHPDQDSGCFPDTPKPPKKPSPFGGSNR